MTQQTIRTTVRQVQPHTTVESAETLIHTVAVPTEVSEDSRGRITQVVMAGRPGRDGQDGAPGAPGSSTGGNYTHSQSVASDVWLVPHNLGFKPNFSVFDSAGTQIVGFGINHLDLNNTELTFGFAFGGEAEAS